MAIITKPKITALARRRAAAYRQRTTTPHDGPAMLNLVLYQPDIPQNLGAMLRLSACLGATVHVVEPCGFPMDAAKLRRVGMDYIHKVQMVRHVNWQAFLDARQGRPGRLLLLETDGTTCYTEMQYAPDDYVVLGSESAGTPRALYKQMDATLTIPMREGMRSLNLAMSAGILVAEACRQNEWRW
ncbi:MAG: tRNA (cytidine(34)-2'-O)-methyltransferase [Alphaproteobacteria bacterium]|nr:tRNA (cytidine(34)-2'-O)-methyltransferase [Alphaproteobacteria bacterium]